jgi:uncharacterized protein YktB (UPF0637 family)
MSQIKARVRPKLKQMGHQLQPFLSRLLGTPVHVHVAKHARRTVNPPDSTWVAWSANARGYKAHPHFQVGLWSSHLFVWFALFPEAESAKATFARNASGQLAQLSANIPENYRWSFDHTRTDAVRHADLDTETLREHILQLETVKKAELLCGIHLQRTEKTVGNSDELRKTIEETFQVLAPLYQLADLH